MFPHTAEKANAADESTAGEDIVDLLETLDADVDPEDDLHHFIAVLVESLSRLGKLSEAIEQIKAKMQSQLMAVISRSSQQVSDSTYVANSPTVSLFDTMDTLYRRDKDGPIFLYNKDAFTTSLRGPFTKRTNERAIRPRW